MPSRVQPPNNSELFGGSLHNDEIELDEEGLEPYQKEALKETQEYYDSLPKIREDLGGPIPNLLHWRTCCQCKDILKYRQHVVVGYGNLSSKVIFIGDGPGRDEKACGIPFVGGPGNALDMILNEVGIGREEVFVDNVVACFTYSKGMKKLRQRDPSPTEVANCRQRLLDTIYQIDPYLIVTLGGVGLKALTGKPGITTNRGRLFTIKIPGFYKMVSYPLIATFHPSYIIRNPALVYHRPEAQPQTKDRYIPTYMSPADLFIEDLKVVKDFLQRLDAFYMT